MFLFCDAGNIYLFNFTQNAFKALPFNTLGPNCEAS